MSPSGEESRGAAIGRRLGALGVSCREFEAKTGIDRKTLRRAIGDGPRVRPNTYKAIELWLEQAEGASPRDPRERDGDDLIEFRLTGLGVDLAVSGPLRAQRALEESVTRLLRELRGRA